VPVESMVMAVVVAYAVAVARPVGVRVAVAVARAVGVGVAVGCVVVVGVGGGKPSGRDQDVVGGCWVAGPA
jgi:hypothetical protein